MTNSTKHPVWFITGASSGIGLALTNAAVARGDQVIGIARDTTAVEKLASEHPEQVLAVKADVREQSQVEEAVRQGLEKFARIDVVANNAGYGVWGAVEEVSDAQARAAFDTNVFGSLNVLRATLPTLRGQGSGHVLQVSAFRGQTIGPGMGLISAFNYAKEGIAETLVAELKPLGIKVTIVEPGPTVTDFVKNFDRDAAVIGDYDQTVRAALKAMGSMPPQAFSPVDRLAQAVLTVVDAEEPPVRLATGSVAVGAIRSALQARLANLDEWEKVSVGVDG